MAGSACRVAHQPRPVNPPPGHVIPADLAAVGALRRNARQPRPPAPIPPNPTPRPPPQRAREGELTWSVISFSSAARGLKACDTDTIQNSVYSFYSVSSVVKKLVTCRPTPHPPALSPTRSPRLTRGRFPKRQAGGAKRGRTEGILRWPWHRRARVYSQNIGAGQGRGAGDAPPLQSTPNAPQSALLSAAGRGYTSPQQPAPNQGVNRRCQALHSLPGASPNRLPSP